ncbi:right-handed parallel beta-helix repeat-containing protein [Methanosarcina barkeri]|uniref:right-handed parallel beta-helix repeat-containing protein n=1 Tax=Methanosarcina barkeri TaxID=2208 RepID=UPI001E52AE36|nr:right-handed parallel beta-helix repeat-containing protein [Methanosarcina barkeri]
MVNFLLLASVSTALCATSSSIVYVAGDGTGKYNCDGKDDHVQINQALKFVASNSKYTTVHLKGPFTYVIDDTLLIGSNTILEGDSSAVIKLANNAGWVAMKPLIKQMSSSGNSNIVVRGFKVNGNRKGNSKVSLGDGHYNIMYFTNCNNIKVYNMYMYDGLGDGLRANSCKNIQFYNNKLYKMGHDGLFAISSQYVQAWKNRITCRTNSGLRIWNSNHVKFHDNVIDSFYDWSAGGPGIQIEKGGTDTGTMDSISIYNNVIHNTYGPGIWIFNYDTASATKDLGKNVRIHNNVFYRTGTNPSITWVGGVIISGFHNTYIENNVFDGIYHVAIANLYPENYSPSYTSKSVYAIIARNNIIVNTLKRKKSPGGTGYGVMNYLASKNHKIYLQYNCLYNNAVGNYKSCTSKTDIHVNPLFASQTKHDYHLKSTTGRWNGKTWVKDTVISPCIDAGHPSWSYSHEPKPNGKRINIGRYGNTIYASKSKS